MSCCTHQLLANWSKQGLNFYNSHDLTNKLSCLMGNSIFCDKITIVNINTTANDEHVGVFEVVFHTIEECCQAIG